MQNNVNLAPGCSTSGQYKCEACTSQFPLKEDLIVHQLLFHSYSAPKLSDNDSSMNIQRRPIHPAEVRGANHPSGFQSPGLSNYPTSWSHNTRTYPSTSVRSPNLPYSPHNFGFGNRDRQVQATVNLVHGSQGSGQFKCDRCSCQFQVREDLVVHQLLCHNPTPTAQFQRPVENPRVPSSIENPQLPNRHPSSDISIGYRDRNPYYYGSGFAYIPSNFPKDSYGAGMSNVSPVMGPTQSDFTGRSNVNPVTVHSLTPLQHSIPEYSTGNTSMSHPPEALDLSYTESNFSKATDGAGRGNMIPISGPVLPYPERNFTRDNDGIEKGSMNTTGGKGYGLTYVQVNITEDAESAARGNVSSVRDSHITNEPQVMSAQRNTRPDREPEQHERQVNHPSIHILSGHDNHTVHNQNSNLLHTILTTDSGQLIANLEPQVANTSNIKNRRNEPSSVISQDNTHRNESSHLITHQKIPENSHPITHRESQPTGSSFEQGSNVKRNTHINETRRPVIHGDFQETRVTTSQGSTVNKTSNNSGILQKNSEKDKSRQMAGKQISQESSSRIAQSIGGNKPTSPKAVPQETSNMNHVKKNAVPQKGRQELQQKPLLQQKQSDTSTKKSDTAGLVKDKIADNNKTAEEKGKIFTNKAKHVTSAAKVQGSAKEDSVNLAKGEGTGQHKCVRCGSGFHVKADLDMHLLVFHSLKKPQREPLKEKPKESTPAEREKLSRTTMKRTVDDILRMLPNKRRTGGVKGEVKVVSVSYRCQTCDISFLTLVGLEEHQYVNHKCRTCEFTFDNKEQLQRHKIIAHMCGMCGHYFQRNESRKTHPCQDNICTICGERVDSKEKLQEHNAENHKCSGCRATFLYKADLDKHRLNKHGHRCSICGYHFKWKEGLKQHILSTHGLKCVTCKARFTVKEELEKHIMENHKCDICSLFFKTAETLQKHKNFIHICNICGVVFKEREKLSKHQYEKHKCSLCNEQFKAQKDLEAHRRSIHKCCFCGVLFDSKQVQDTHPCETYKCPCGANYETEDELELHSKENHFCPFCDIFFLMKEEFLSHRNTHHRCSICKAQYVLKVNLEKHKVTDHNCQKCGASPEFENKKDPSICECGENLRQAGDQSSAVQSGDPCKTNTTENSTTTDKQSEKGVEKPTIRTAPSPVGSKTDNGGSKSSTLPSDRSDSLSETDKSQDNLSMTRNSKSSASIPNVHKDEQDQDKESANSSKHETSAASPLLQETTNVAAEICCFCHLCKQQFESQGLLTHHIRGSHSTAAENCHSDLLKKKLTDHGNKAKGAPLSPQLSKRNKVNRVFKCRYCHWRFNNFARFKRHTSRHEKCYRTFWHTTPKKGK